MYTLAPSFQNRRVDCRVWVSNSFQLLKNLQVITFSCQFCLVLTIDVTIVFLYVGNEGHVIRSNLLEASGGAGGVGQDHVQQLLLTLHSFHYGVLHREKKHLVATNGCVFRPV